MSAARYIVGIDLGTTNSVVAYCDTAAGDATSGKVEVLPIPQLTAPGTVEARPRLPSFLYLPMPEESAGDALRLPWKASPRGVVGTFAQKRGNEVPTRLVTSAKSWLSYAGADRNAALLPWASSDDVEKISPVDASAEYLSHLHHAWNAAFRGSPLKDQEVLLTVPASFDAAARELTVRAAQNAGLPTVTIIEEPQAAFYAWIDSLGDGWRQAVHVGDVVLVCDIGGGTTDFSLIAVRERKGELNLERVAVGDHLLLGGDNMDMALAYAVRDRLGAGGTHLDNWQFRSLILSCRDAKENLLGGSKEVKQAVAILGRGRKVIGGTLRVDVERTEIDATLIEGFFPRCSLGDRPQAQRRSALQEIGLPYAADAAVTRHLSHFLTRNQAALAKDNSERPTAVLFNGGVMQSLALRERLVSVMATWFPEGPPLRLLSADDPESAVARGAAYYGLAKRGRGVRIRGGTARAYYIGIETAMPAVPGVRPPIKALCIAPRGIEEGTDVDLPPQEFGLVVGEPAEFRFLSSATRRDDRVGTPVEEWNEDITELDPLEATVQWKGHEGTTVPVRLQARVTELGVLELWCVSRDGKQRWKLEFNVRGSA